MTVSTIPVKADQAIEFWPEIEPYIVKALALDPVNMASVESIKAQVASGEGMVLVCLDGPDILAATVCVLINTKEGPRVLHILVSAGDEVDKWFRSLLNMVRELARAEGAAFITTSGRPGWAKKFAKQGFQVAQVTMRAEVDSGVIQLRR